VSINQSVELQRLQANVELSIQQHWGIFLAEGLVLLAFGSAAILIPPIAGIAVAIMVGWLFLLSGVLGLATTFLARHAPGFGWSLASAVLGIAVGVAMLGWPVQGLLSLTLLLIVFFTIEGVTTIMFALEHRRRMSGRWGVMLASGIVDLILAAMVVAGLPGTAAWAIGLLVGINMIFGGTALIMMALHARAARSATSARTP
jgi:uncharacterized membrane protein HdeD (DUF308 family)